MDSQVDDGEPLRKAALSCIDTILDSLPHRLDVGTLMPYLARVREKISCHSGVVLLCLGILSP